MKSFVLAVAATTTFSAAALHAEVADPGLAGHVATDLWSDLTAAANPGFPRHPGSADWAFALISDTGDAGLIKTANGIDPRMGQAGPYPATNSLYFGGTSSTPNHFGGSLAITDDTPLALLSQVVFQIKIGEAFGYDFHDAAFPTLSFNGGTQALAATEYLITVQEPNGTFATPEGPEDLYNNTYAFSWDLSGILEQITGVSIHFSGVQHAQVYQLRLDQSDIYTPLAETALATPAAVPTPSAVGLIAASGLGLLLRRRRS